MPRIEEVFAFLIIEENEEYFARTEINGIEFPLVGLDREFMDTRLRSFAQDVADLHGRPVRLARFECREDLGAIHPSSPRSARARRARAPRY